MLDDAIKTKLRDPFYLDLHLYAARATHEVGHSKWYDSVFLRRYEVARHFLAAVNPSSLERFLAGFDLIKPPAYFRPALLDEVFDAATRGRILETSRSIRVDETNKQTRWEIDSFGRRVIWDHPCFLELQRDILPRVSELAQCELVPTYNFLSLYSGNGVCQVHMDQPVSMYTLDYCIEQSVEWPIHFSKVVEWPNAQMMKSFDAAAIKADPALEFESYILQPNQALFFNGSSQWHYREAITPGGFCNLLFFHYCPAGCESLVRPTLWADHFDIPELAPLCDLLALENSEADEPQ